MVRKFFWGGDFGCRERGSYEIVREKYILRRGIVRIKFLRI